MSQVSKYPISKNIFDRIFEIFLKTFTQIRNKEEADEFISDFLTPTEKIMLAKRLAIAFLLEKDYDYRTIQSIIRVSSATITSVNMALKYGSEGYKKLIERILKEEKLISLLENSISKLLSMPSSLERGSGSWTYLKREIDKERKKSRKSF